MNGYTQFGSHEDIDGEKPCHPRNPKCRCAICVLVSAALLIIISVALAYGIGLTPLSNHERYPAIYAGPFQNAVIQTESEECSTIGYDILQRNGSVVDAAVAVQICTGVTSPQSCGLGGGFFMTLYAKPNTGSSTPVITTINAREVAPANISKHSNVEPSGGMSVAVPVEPQGLYYIWQRYGRLSWEELLIPTIKLLQQGVSINQHLGHSLQKHEDGVRSNPGLSALFLRPDGMLKTQGDVYHNMKLLTTLQLMAKSSGPDLLDDNMKTAIIQDIQEAGGIITKEDIDNIQVRSVEPVISYLPYKNLTLYSPPPPSGGVVLQFILHIMDGYNSTFTESPLDAQRMVEAFKFGYARRSSLGDANFVEIEQIVEEMTNEEYVSSIRRKIKDTQVLSPSEYGADFFQPPDSGTCGHNIIAPDGSAVATTSTINTAFGSTVVGTRTGIIFNNDMDDFSSPDRPNYAYLPPSPSNFVEPGKAPMSSMSPTLIFKGTENLYGSISGTGGSLIPSAVAQVVLRYFYGDSSARDAVTHPRLHHQLEPDVLFYEEDYPQETLDILKEYGQTNQALMPEISLVGMAVNLCEQLPPGDSNRNCQRMGVTDGRSGGAVTGF